MNQMVQGHSQPLGAVEAPQITTAPAAEALLNHTGSNNDQLESMVSDIYAFLARMIGHNVPQSPETSKDQEQGILLAINYALDRQTSLLSKLRDAVKVLEQIG